MPQTKQKHVTESETGSAKKSALNAGSLSPAQKRWLKSGLVQPGGKLPLFDDQGRQVPARTIRSCIDAGWAEPWFSNPIKPDWLVCKLAPAAFEALSARAKGKKS